MFSSLFVCVLGGIHVPRPPGERGRGRVKVPLINTFASRVFMYLCFSVFVWFVVGRTRASAPIAIVDGQSVISQNQPLSAHDLSNRDLGARPLRIYHSRSFFPSLYSTVVLRIPPEKQHGGWNIPSYAAPPHPRAAARARSLPLCFSGNIHLTSAGYAVMPFAIE